MSELHWTDILLVVGTVAMVMSTYSLVYYVGKYYEEKKHGNKP